MKPSMLDTTCSVTVDRLVLGLSRGMCKRSHPVGHDRLLTPRIDAVANRLGARHNYRNSLTSANQAAQATRRSAGGAIRR
jgi:hypothetical protein